MLVAIRDDQRVQYEKLKTAAAPAEAIATATVAKTYLQVGNNLCEKRRRVRLCRCSSLQEKKK